MKLTAKLAFSQIKKNRSRTTMTLLGIVLSSAMLTAVCGFAWSAKGTLYTLFGMRADAPLHTVVVAMGAILGGLVMAASIIVVSGAFRVSAAERTRQFGILKSVGATRRQIAQTVLYEGVILGMVGIPVGIAVGLLIEWIGVAIVTNLLRRMAAGGTLNLEADVPLVVSFAAPPLMFVVAVITSLGTVWLSAWLPARKAAKMPAIDAIRNTGEVKMKAQSTRRSKLTYWLFGFEGVLAAKSLKRSRRSFRATVLSLTIGIVLLIAAASFGGLMKRSANAFFEGIDATVAVEWSSELHLIESGGEKSVTFINMSGELAQIISDRFTEYGVRSLFGIGGNSSYVTTLPDGTKTNFALAMVDRASYEKLCADAGVSVGSNLLVNYRREKIDGVITEYVPHRFADFKGRDTTFALPGHEPVTLTIDGELSHIYNEINDIFGYVTTIIVPECETATYVWYVDVEDASGFAAYAETVLDHLAPKETDETDVYMTAMDISALTAQINNLVDTVMLFVYGFAGMLTLIAVTSVISTINTNIGSRAREFAMLESVGMTKAGVKKMLNLESLLCSARSLVFGIPLGLLGAYGLYLAIGASIQLPFEWPWLVIVVCIGGVFVVTWITRRYAASRLKHKNIIETIRGE